MKVIVTANDLINKGHWDDYCENHGWNVWIINEGLMSSADEITLTEEEARKYGFL